MGKETQQIQSSAMSGLLKNQGLKRKSASIIAGLSISLLTFNSVDALNIGEARSQSFLGQPLNIFVPVDDAGKIIDLNQLIVSQPTLSQLQALNVPQPSAGLSYQVIEKGPTKGILITSQEPFNEPYVDIGIKVDYQGVSQLSKLTALIDLQPPVTELSDNANNSGTIGAPLQSLQQQNSTINGTPVEQITSTVSSRSNTGVVTYSSDLMGPYDWAQKGAIPAKFGPVLEGQSLWRVARRINEAMDVSIDQMMWALFRSNPQAFSGDNVSTLQSGSILTIPDEAFVREVTELGAVRLLNPQAEAEADIVNVTATSDQVSAENDPVVQLSTLETVQAESQQETIAVAENKIAETVVTSDTTTVAAEAELSPGIESLNEQSALAPLDTSVTTDASIASEDVATNDSGVVSLSRLSVIDDLKNEINYLNQQVADQGKRIQELERRLAFSESTGVAPAVNETSSTIEQPTVGASNSENITTVDQAANTVLSDSSIKTWSIAALGLFLLGLAYIARDRIMPIVLRALGGRYEYDEEAPFLESVSKKRKPLRDLSTIQEKEEVNESRNDVIGTKPDEQDDFEDYSFFVDDEELMDVEELSFPDRIKQLIDSGDFDEAKKTVNFATEANVNEHDINIYLLKIFAAESDREGFDKLFDKIHANIDEYDAEAQLVVAELQSEMAIGKVINFNSEKMVG